MAKKTAQPAAKAGDVKVRLLVDCYAGKCGKVVALPAAEVAQLVKDGVGDDNPSAVAAGEG